MQREATRKKHFTGIVLLLLAVILLLAGIACWLAVQLYREAEPALAGSWRMQLDLTEIARERAASWLHGAELGEQVALNLPRLQVTVLLTLETDGRWSCRVDEASYTAAQKQAEKALAVSLRELLRLRAAAAGRKAESADAMEARLEAALGMTGEQYLAKKGPALLPALDALQAEYDGGGSYEISGQHIRFDGHDTQSFALSARLLALSGEKSEVYTR